MDGWIKLHRRLADQPMWVDEPFTRGQAWVDLLIMANHSDGFLRVQGIKVPLSRGDVGRSEATLAGRWKWSRGKVRRFVEELISEKMINKKSFKNTDRRKSVITIMNYSIYQDGEITDGTGDGTGDGQATDRRRYSNKNDKNDKKNKEEKIIGAKPKNGFDLSVLPLEIDRSVIEAFIEHRKTTRGKLTQYALGLVCSSAIKCSRDLGITPEAAIDIAIERGWSTVRTEWVRNAGKNGGSGSPRQKYMQDVDKLIGGDYEPIGGRRGGQSVEEIAQPLSRIGAQRGDHGVLGS